jgi:hypothetical protein
MVRQTKASCFDLGNPCSVPFVHYFIILPGYPYFFWVADGFVISAFAPLAAFGPSSVWICLAFLEVWILGAHLARGEQQMWVFMSSFLWTEHVICKPCHLVDKSIICAEGVHSTFCRWWTYWGCWLPWRLARAGPAGPKWTRHSHCTGMNCFCYVFLLNVLMEILHCFR